MKAQQQATLPKSPDQRRAQYHAYLSTPEWQAKRLAALERADYRCQLCNASKRLDVHHRTYERIFHERDGDLTVLCRKCHDHFHTKRHPQPSKQSKRKKAAPSKLAGARDVTPLKAEAAPIVRTGPPGRTPRLRKAAHQQRVAALKAAAVARDPFVPKHRKAA